MKKPVVAIAAAALGCGLLFTPKPGAAHKIYALQGSQWAIICDDGAGYSFSGSASGASEAAALLCAGGFAVTSEGSVAGAGTVTRGELLDATSFLAMDAGGRLALRPGACAGVNGRMQASHGGSGGSGAAGMAISEQGMPIDKKDKKKGKPTMVQTGSGQTGGASAGSSSAAAARTGDCTVKPGRPGSTR